MTREEAIQILKAKQSVYNGAFATSETKKVYCAYDMAISALSATNDAIKTDDEVIEMPMFKESAKAYKEWTGEDMGKSDLISRADAVAYPLGFNHYDEKNGNRKFICGVESYREYIQHLPSVSAEPTTRERKEAKSTLLTLKHLFEDEEILKSLDVAIECVSAERVGEWLEIEDYNGDYHYQCSVCKDEFYLEYGTPKENGYAYCPSCGARMENKK